MSAGGPKLRLLVSRLARALHYSVGRKVEDVKERVEL